MINYNNKAVSALMCTGFCILFLLLKLYEKYTKTSTNLYPNFIQNFKILYEISHLND